MASKPLFIKIDFFCIFPMNFAMATLGSKEFTLFLKTYGSHNGVLLEIAKKNLVSIPVVNRVMARSSKYHTAFKLLKPRLGNNPLCVYLAYDRIFNYGHNLVAASFV